MLIICFLNYLDGYRNSGTNFRSNNGKLTGQSYSQFTSKLALWPCMWPFTMVLGGPSQTHGACSCRGRSAAEPTVTVSPLFLFFILTWLHKMEHLRNFILWKRLITRRHGEMLLRRAITPFPGLWSWARPFPGPWSWARPVSGRTLPAIPVFTTGTGVPEVSIY